ncbi:MAG: hypothetical protein L0216_01775 [Planctomycetales bacterium]|nr:hypothetical protein [Planctomycetales bacterium]
MDDRAGHPNVPAGDGGDAEAFRRHKQEQIRLGLKLTPAERLRWLEDTVEEMRELQRQARSSRP